MLAVRGSPTGSTGFLAGTGFFALAHVFWTIGQLKDSRPDMRALVAFGLPVVVFASIRLAPVFSFATSAAIVAYSAVSAVSLSVAFGSRRRYYLAGISLLVLSDLAIGARMLHVPAARYIVGPTYILAETLLVVSCFHRGEPRFDSPRRGASAAHGPLRSSCRLRRWRSPSSFMR